MRLFKIFVMIILIIIVSLSMEQIAFADTSLNDSLVAYYPFDGNADDYSGNGFHGSVNGASLTKGFNGIAYKALSFDGINDNVIIGDIDKLKIEGDLTISFWMKVSELGNILGIITCQANANDYSPGTNALYKLNFQYSNYIHYCHESGDGQNFFYSFSEHEFTTSKWYHMAFVRTSDERKIELFVDGDLVSTGYYDIIPENGDLSTVRIGEDHGSVKAERFFHGALDEIRIYNRTMGTEEIKMLAAKEIVLDFVADTTLGNAPYEVQFTDMSYPLDPAADIQAWAWDFNNDGTIDSEEPHPNWVYEKCGLYSVKLTVFGQLASYDLVKENYITVLSEEPFITEINDIPKDNGGMVEVLFMQSIYDVCSPGMSINSTESYTIELDDGTGWRAATSLVAYGKKMYSALVSTTKNFTVFDDGFINFRVIAGMDEGTYISQAVAGYSFDNIKPAPPKGLYLTSEESSTVTLNWDKSMDDDFYSYIVYRNTTTNFLENSVAYSQTYENSFADPLYGSEQRYYYAVKTMDIAGNHSGFSNIVSTRITDVAYLEEEKIDSYSMSQNFPNPFNPVTGICYSIPETANVVIQVYDLLGREIVTLVEESKVAGHYKTRWNGCDEAGHSVTSGVYIYRIEAGTFSQVNKMILLH